MVPTARCSWADTDLSVACLASLIASARHSPTINQDDRPTDVVRGLGGQKDNGVFQILRLAPTLCRNGGADFFVRYRITDQLMVAADV